MVLVSVELTKKKVNVDKIRTVPKVSIKMKSSVKKSYFFFITLYRGMSIFSAMYIAFCVSHMDHQWKHFII